MATYPPSGRQRQLPPVDESEAWQGRNRENAATYDASARDTTPFSAEQQGRFYAEAQQGFAKGVSSVSPGLSMPAANAVAPQAPAPITADRARFGVMRRSGIDPKTGQEYGFVGTGAGGQGNQTFDSYEGAREFSQGTQAQAGTSLPYTPPVGNEQRGFSADGSRDVRRPLQMPGAPQAQPPATPDGGMDPRTRMDARDGRSQPMASTAPGFIPATPPLPVQPLVAQPPAVDMTPRPVPTPTNSRPAPQVVNPSQAPLPAGKIRRADGVPVDAASVQGNATGGILDRLYEGSALDVMNKANQLPSRRSIRQSTKRNLQIPNLDAGTPNPATPSTDIPNFPTLKRSGTGNTSFSRFA